VPGSGKTAGANGPAKKPSLPKRFYQEVTVVPDERGGVSVRLDGKPIRTPGKAPLVLPNAALAEAVAAEWRAQGERITPHTMPLTKLANSVIDGVKGCEAEVVGDMLGYAGSDLICYRADGPEALTVAQARRWDPLVAFAEKKLKAPLRLAHGLVHVQQPRTSLEAIRERLETFDAWGLAALHVLTGLTGSALVALAVALGELTPEEAWDAAHVDEDWQISQWGEDAEAAERRKRHFRDFAAAAQFGRLHGAFGTPKP
jgi:chaperone required for assembly of F1-ATPase